MTRPIRWDVIENNYDQLIKYAPAAADHAREIALRVIARHA
jgi:hypothetical protein